MNNLGDKNWTFISIFPRTNNFLCDEKAGWVAGIPIGDGRLACWREGHLFVGEVDNAQPELEARSKESTAITIAIECVSMTHILCSDVRIARQM
jgi:hypothetical protein